MWFKNLRIYRFSKPFDLSNDEFEAKLASAPFTPCAKTQANSYGWTQAMGKHGQLFSHVSGDKILFCAKNEEKLLPAAIINELLDEKVAELEAKEGFKPGRKQREQIKEELVIDLLPRAFSRKRLQYAYIDKAQQMLIVDASSSNKAEELTEYLRKTLGSLAVVPFKLANNIPGQMTAWLHGKEAITPFLLGESCELKEAEQDGAVVRCSKQDLLCDEIKVHLDAGKQVHKLALKYLDKIDFVLAEDLSLKRLKFSDEILEKVDNDAGEDPASRFDADFTLMSMELAEFIPHLAALFDAEESWKTQNT